jgi:hypothetical protein
LGQLDRTVTKRGRALTRTGAAAHHCSFCFKPQRGVKTLIAGPGGVFICDECVVVCSQLTAGRSSAFPDYPRVETLETDWLLALLQPLETTIRGKGSQLQWLIETLRLRKVSWARIGKALNISRQSAWERFSRPAQAGQSWRMLRIPTDAERPAREK